MVTLHAKKWELELLGDEFEEYLLDGINTGFDIVDSDSVPDSCTRRNYKSTSGENHKKVELRINEEITKGHYIRTLKKPHVVHWGQSLKIKMMCV